MLRLRLLLLSALLSSAGPLRAAVSEIRLPPVASTRMGETRIFSSANFEALALVGELDEGELLELSVSEGRVSLAGDAGLSFSEGDGSDDTLVRVSGSAAALNAALDGLVYTPPDDWAGGVVLSLDVLGEEPRTATLSIAVHAPLDPAAVQDVVLASVSSVHSGLQPGHLVAYGREAYDIADYPGGPSAGPAVVAASWGAGRVLAVGDHQMLDMDSYGAASGRFYENGLAWLADGDATSIRIVTLAQGVADWLAGQGYTDVVVTDLDALPGALAEAALFVPPWLGPTVSDEALAAIADFVRSGGGLFLAEYGVGYLWWWEGPVCDAPGNRLLRQAGVGFVASHRWDEGEIAVTPSHLQPLGAEGLLALLDDSSTASEDLLVRAAVLLTRIHDALPLDDPLARQLERAFQARVGAISPTPLSPVDEPWEQALLLRESALLEATAPEEVTAHRTVASLYGAVPDEAPRSPRTLTIDPAVTRWHSTGLYAPPGELVTLHVPAAAAERGFVLRISGHTDDISDRESWLRMPRVARSFAVSATETLAASAFGGALYFDVGTESRDLAPFPITIEGAVAAPHFVLGEDTDADWQAGLRDAPAPYAELVSPHLSLSLPASFVRDLEEPEALLVFWDEVVALQDELGQHAALRSCGERINIDVQVSAGWLHAGYPAQGARDAAAELVELDDLYASGSWGWFHELGHEAQRRPDKSWGWDNPYTFDDSVEVTVNLFTSYVFDRQGQTSRGGWSWTASPLRVFQKALSGLAGGTYADGDAATKLAMMLQLRDGWGWEAWQGVLATYQGAGEQPSGDAEERDAFLLRFSTQVGHDLSLFLGEIWGLSFTEAAAAEVAPLPDWLPAMGGLEGDYLTMSGTSLDFDLAGSALSLDGVAEIVDVVPGTESLDEVAPGLWRFAPASDFVGEDRFSYGVRSSTGHVRRSEVTVAVGAPAALMESWYEIEGSSLQDLVACPDYPDAPHEVALVPSFEIPVNAHDQYGVRLRGVLRTTESGDYRFWIASDDNGALFLGDDGRPSSKRLIATVPYWTSHRQWDRFDEQRSAPISLEAGRDYYLEALVKEGGGGDNLSVAWALDDGDPVVLAAPHVSPWDEDAVVVEPPRDAGEAELVSPADVAVSIDAGEPTEDAVSLAEIVAPDAAGNELSPQIRIGGSGCQAGPSAPSAGLVFVLLLGVFAIRRSGSGSPR